MSEKKEFEFEIIEKGTKLGETTAKGWTLEINKVSYNGNEAKWDIRAWNGDHSRMGKGISLNYSELAKLQEFLNKIL